MSDSDRYTILSVRNTLQPTGDISHYSGISVISGQSGNIAKILRCLHTAHRESLRYAGFWFPYSTLTAEDKQEFISFLIECKQLETVDIRSNHDWPSDFFEETLCCIKKVRYLHLHDARLNLNCLEILKTLLPTLFELSIPHCSPGRRSPIAIEFASKLESLREYIRQYSHLMPLYAFVDSSETSLASPLNVKETNTVFLRKLRSPMPFVSELPDFTQSTVDEFYRMVDSSNICGFRAWFFIDVKGRLCILEGWDSFEKKTDDMSSFGLVALRVNVKRRCGHLAEVVIADTYLNFIVECFWLEPLAPTVEFEVSKLQPGTIVEISTERLRTLSSHSDGSLHCHQSGSSLAFVLDCDLGNNQALVASIIRSTTRLTDEAGRVLHEDDVDANVVRDYFDVLCVSLKEVVISPG